MENSIEDSKINELIMNDSVEMLKERNIKNKAIEPLLELMERNPLVSFDNPGAIVHYLENIDTEIRDCVKDILKCQEDNKEI